MPPVFRLLFAALVLGLWGSPVAEIRGQPVGRKPKPAPAAKARRPLPTPPDTARVRLLAEAHHLQTDYHESEALGKYEQILAKAPATYEALWQAAVLSVRIGNRYSDETRKTAYFAAARLYANRALVVRPEGAEGHYAEALTLATQAPLLPLRGRLLAYREMRPHVYQATELRPKWAEAWQLLGRWHYRVDHYSLPERIYSRLFLGGVPVGGSTLLALEALRRAHELDPKRIEYAYDLVRVYLNRSQQTWATAVLQEALELTPVTAEELVISRRCRLLLEQLNRRLRRQLQRRLKNL